MCDKNILKGKVFVEAENKKKKICYTAKSVKTDFRKCLIGEFKYLQLSPHEKQNLTYLDRENICFYQDLENRNLEQETDDLAKIINKLHGQGTRIKAEHYGAYLCLVAICSGKIKNVDAISFDLESLPLKLFPEHLLMQRDILEQSNIQFNVQDSSWLNKFESLYDFPSAVKKAA